VPSKIKTPKQYKPMGFGDRDDKGSVEAHLRAKAEAREMRQYNTRIKELEAEDGYILSVQLHMPDDDFLTLKRASQYYEEDSLIHRQPSIRCAHLRPGDDLHRHDQSPVEECRDFSTEQCAGSQPLSRIRPWRPGKQRNPCPPGTVREDHGCTGKLLAIDQNPKATMRCSGL
jgi:hypothetical protein